MRNVPEVKSDRQAGKEGVGGGGKGERVPEGRVRGMGIREGKGLRDVVEGEPDWRRVREPLLLSIASCL